MHTNLDLELNILAIIKHLPDVGKIFMPLLKEEYFSSEAHRLFFKCFSTLGGRVSDDVLSVEQWFTANGYEWHKYSDKLIEMFSPNLSPDSMDRYCSDLERLYRARTAVADFYAAQSVKCCKEYLAKITEITHTATLSEVKDETKTEAEVGIELIEQLTNQEPAKGVPTGIKRIDDIIHVLPEGEVTVIAGRSGHGKTTFLTQLCQSTIDGGATPLFISLEISTEALMRRIVAQRTDIPASEIFKGKLGGHDLGLATATIPRIVEEWAIRDNCSRYMNQLNSRIRMEMLRKRYDILYIDYLQLIRGDKFTKRHEALGDIMKMLIAIAKDYHLPVVTAAQLNRATEAQKTTGPILSHLKESGSIEEDAAIVMFVYRPNMGQEGDANEAEIRIAKSRFSDTGFIRCRFDSECTRFTIDT